MHQLPQDSDEYYAKTFVGLQLGGATLAGKEFDTCEFAQCDFSEATLTDCKFIDCHFKACNLSLLKVDRSHWRGVAFDACKLVGVNWTRASWPRVILAPPLQFRECVLDESSFFGLQLPELIVESCKAREVDLREANLTAAKFCCTDLSNSLFGRTGLRGADFVEAIGYNIDVFDNDIRHARFSRHEAVRLLDGLDIELVD